MSNSTLATQPSRPMDLRTLIQHTSTQQQLIAALPAFFKPDQFTVIVRTAINKNPKLLECTPESFLVSVLSAAQMGIAPNGRDGHLIPRNKKQPDGSWVAECTFQPDYKGLVKLMRRDPNVADVYAVVVREGDIFDLAQGLDRGLVHKPDPFSTRTLIGVYAVIRYRDGSSPSFEWMNRGDVEAVREHSDSWKKHIDKGYSTPWKTDEGEMWKKTAINRISKTADLSPDTADRVAIDTEATVERVQIERPQFDPLPAAQAPAALPERASEEQAREGFAGVKEAVATVAEKPKERRLPTRPAKAQEVPVTPAATPAPATPEPAPQPADEAPLPGGEVETVDRAGDTADESPHARLRARCVGFSDADILRFCIAHRLAETTAQTYGEASGLKIERVLSDPTLAEVIADFKAK